MSRFQWLQKTTGTNYSKQNWWSKKRNIFLRQFQILEEVKDGDQESIAELTQRQVLLLDIVDQLSLSSTKICETEKLLAPNSNQSLRVSLALSADEELSDQISVLESVRKAYINLVVLGMFCYFEILKFMMKIHFRNSTYFQFFPGFA